MRTTPPWARPSITWPSCIEPRASTAEAEGLFERALAIREKALGASHPDVGQTLNNLANVYRDQGKYAEAEGLFKRALMIREQALGPNHPDVTATRHNLAACSFGARPHRRGGGGKSALGVTSLAVAQTLHNRALASWRQGKYSEAEGLYKRALAIREQALGANHPDVGQHPQQPGARVSAQGKYTEAEGLFERALAIREKALGATTPTWARPSTT